MLACGNVRLHNIVFHPTSSSLDLFKWEINPLNCVYTADKEVRWESEFVEAERLGMLWCGDSATRTHIHMCACSHTDITVHPGGSINYLFHV